MRKSAQRVCVLVLPSPPLPSPTRCFYARHASHCNLASYYLTPLPHPPPPKSTGTPKNSYLECPPLKRVSTPSPLPKTHKQTNQPPPHPPKTNQTKNNKNQEKVNILSSVLCKYYNNNNNTVFIPPKNIISWQDLLSSWNALYEFSG